MKRFMTVLVLAALVAAGCTSGDDGDAADVGESTTTTTTTEAPDDDDPPPAPDDDPPPAPDDDPPPADPADDFVDQSLEGDAPGVTDDAIRIGITYIDLSTVTSVSLDRGDPDAIWRALIDAENARGGINGRMIDPVIAPISFADGGNADAVCVELTQDNDVFVVMGFFFADQPACYVELYEKPIVGGQQTSDLLARSTVPWYSTEGSDADGDAVALFAELGALDGTFAIFSQVGSEAAVRDVVVPALEAAGLEPVDIAVNDAPNDDEAAREAQNAVIRERFESLGVDTVLTAGPDGISAAVAFETSSYRPRLVMTSDATIRGFIVDEGRDLSVLDDALLAGAFGPDAAIYSDPDMAQCIEDVQAGGVEWFHPDEATEDDPEVWLSVNEACTTLALFKAIATFAGPNLNYGTYAESGDTIGDVKLPGNPQPFFFGPPPSTDGDAPRFLYEWDAEASDFVLS